MNDADRAKVERWQARAAEAAEFADAARAAADDDLPVAAERFALSSIALSLSVIAGVVTASLAED